MTLYDKARKSYDKLWHFPTIVNYEINLWIYDRVRGLQSEAVTQCQVKIIFGKKKTWTKATLPCCCWPSADGVPERTAGDALRSLVTVSGLFERIADDATPVLLLNFCFLEELLGDEVTLESWPRFEPAVKRCDRVNMVALPLKVWILCSFIFNIHNCVAHCTKLLG